MAVVATLASQESSTPNSLSSADPDPRAVAALWTLWERMAAMVPGKWARANGAAPVAQTGALTTAMDGKALTLDPAAGTLSAARIAEVRGQLPALAHRTL
jgi:hypothetical protein